MYFASIDCGTTNSRVYIIDDKQGVVGKGTRNVGVRNTSMSGSKEILKNGLKEAFFEALNNASLTLSDINFTVSAGMITSEIGLCTVPHLTAPVGCQELAEGMVKKHDLSIFPIDLPIYFIPGIKNKLKKKEPTVSDVNHMDFMRGEETQIIGLVEKKKYTLPVTAVILSSHTKFISINQKGQIDKSLTTMSGQVYEAVKKQTFLGKSMEKVEGINEPVDFFDTEIIKNAYEIVKDSGFLRSMIITRFMDVLLNTKWYESKLFVESAIAADDIKVLLQFKDAYISDKSNIVLIGHERRCKIYRYILNDILNYPVNIEIMSDVEEIDSLNIEGTINILKTSQILS